MPDSQEIRKCVDELILMCDSIPMNGKERADRCLDPYGAGVKNDHFNNISEILYKETGATHFDIKWANPDRTMIELNLYEGENFGAIITPPKLLMTFLLAAPKFISRR
jgi:hypothetical protein